MPAGDRLSHIVDQLLLREEAAVANPEFATIEGRALEDVRQTLAYLAVGKRPQTVLGGLLNNIHGPFDSTLAAHGARDAIEVSVKGGIIPVGPNELGDTVQDTLEGLVNLGLVERAYTPGSVDSLLLEEDDHDRIMNRPTYRISARSLPDSVQATVDWVDDGMREAAEYQERREVKKAARQQKGGLFGRRRRGQTS